MDEGRNEGDKRRKEAKMERIFLREGFAKAKEERGREAIVERMNAERIFGEQIDTAASKGG